MVKNLTFITGNAGKAEQLGRHLDFAVSHAKLELPAPAEGEPVTGGLLAVHALADELEELLNRDAVYYVYPWNREYHDVTTPA